MDSYSAPVFARDEQSGKWENADLSLTKTEEGIEPAAGPAEVVFSNGADSGDAGGAPLAELTSVNSAGEPASLELGWEGDLPAPVLEDEVATYPGAAEDVTGVTEAAESPEGEEPSASTGADVQVAASSDGFTHSVVLNGPPDGDVTLSFPLTLSEGLAATVDAESGGIFVRDEAGKVVFYAPRPMMWDTQVDQASGDPARIVPLETSLEGPATSPVLVLTADAGFLADPDTQYPVTIDPAWSKLISSDTWTQTGYTSSQAGSLELRAGTYDGGANRARSFLKVPTDALNGKKILSAGLQLRNFYSGLGCTPASVLAQRVTQAWEATAVTWAAQPSATTSGQGAYSPAYSAQPRCMVGERDALFPVTPIVQHWADNPSANFGFRIIAADETDGNSWRRYRSANYAPGADDPAEPHLRVTYNSYPNTPASPSMTPGQYAWYPSSSDPNRVLYATTTKPTLSAVVTDADGGSVRGLFSLLDGTTATWNQLAGSTVASGGRSTFTPGSSTPALVNGRSYAVRAWSNDGSLTSKSFVAPWTFIVDTSAPATPTIVSTGYTSGGWKDPAPASNTFTFKSTSTDVVNFQYSKDRGSWVTVAAAGSPPTATLSWAATGSHSLDVRAIDKAGNISGATTFNFGAGGASLTSPTSSAKSTDTVTIRASAPPAGTGTVTPSIYWRAAGTSEPANFSTTLGSTTGWTRADVLPAVAAGNTVSVSQAWSAAAAAADLGKERVPVLLDVQVCFAYSDSGITRCTRTGDTATRTSVLRVPHAFGDGFPTADAGPGEVSLWTGELAIDATDVVVPGYTGDLSISRSYASFAGEADATNAVFGPGWTANLDGPDVGLAGLMVVDNTILDGTIALVDGNGTTLVYRQPGEGKVQDATGTYAPVDEDTRTYGGTLTLTGDTSSATITLTQDDGTVTTWSRLSYSAGKPSGWAPAAVTEPGGAGTTSFSHDSAGRVTRILGAVQPGVTCPATGALNPGCRALRISYATATTATDSTAGNYIGQVQGIWYEAYNPDKAGGAGMDSVQVASYAYNSAGQLTAVTDPRSDLTTRYGYSDAPAGSTTPLLASLTPSGQAKWTFGYGATSQGSHGLLTVSRDPALGSGPATVQSRCVYGINGTMSSSGLPDMRASAVAMWGQTEAPTYGAAVFDAGHPVNTSTATSVAAADWPYADLYYTDALGYTVNTASYGAGDWQLTATEYDGGGRVVRELAPGAIALIRQAADESNLPAGTPLADADSYATITRYNPDIATTSAASGPGGGAIAAGTVIIPAGTLITDTWEPARQVGVNGDRVRPHTHVDYDQGAPNAGVNPATGLGWRLPTTVTLTQAASDTGTSDPSVPSSSGEPVVRQTLTGYAPIDGASVTGVTSGWVLGASTTSTTVMDSAANNITSKTRYDDSGRVIETRQPKSSGTDAGTTITTYYTAAANSLNSACGLAPQWAGLPCRTGSAESSPTVSGLHTTGYTMLLAPSEVVEVSGGVTRTNSTAYLDDGRKDVSTTTVTGLGVSKPVPATRVLYDEATGLATGITSMDGADNEIDRIESEYDAWGRTIRYADRGGEVTRTIYASSGHVAEVVDPTGTTTYTYDSDSERRGLPTKIEVTGGGVITGEYDAAGRLVQQDLPGGIVQETAYDEVGNAIGLSYAGPADDGHETWLAWSQAVDVASRVVAESTPRGTVFNTATDPAAGTVGANAYARTYTYDRASRLITVTDRTAAAAGDPVSDDISIGSATPCVVRSYDLDGNSNRTALATTISGTDGECTTDSPTTRSWTYDSADRVESGSSGAGGHVYDELGRQIVVPGTDAPSREAGALTVGYDDSDAARSVSQNGATTEYTYDPAGRRATATKTDSAGIVTENLVRHYTNQSDNPGWATTNVDGATTTIRYGSSINQELAVEVSGSVVSVHLHNLHGDTSAKVSLQTVGAVAVGIDAWHDYDEFGNQVAPPPDTAGIKHGWLGGAQRARDDSGLLLMGARLYAPNLGRFLTRDSLPGGCANSYVYTYGDPINTEDLDGRASKCRSFTKTSSSGLGAFTLYRDNGNWAFRASLTKAALALPGLQLDRTVIRGSISFGVGRDRRDGGLRNRYPNYHTAHGRLPWNPDEGTLIYMHATITILQIFRAGNYETHTRTTIRAELWGCRM
ncbi:hypothetical protein DQ239_12110 [Blastococcus sp. TF02-09]|uniref:DNRLRE domain-containing protein n=1 Tax=Blastococcus sp. TF02-09 TaxID=2250576 RepID=UPI000DEA90D5|nr:DNRLRE domain-containing protein [Blastococcus sp. TF02-9]RBY76927.1 hypothetical protein DQ239_12110 [Blastococcus sp. TF02-9]